MYCNCPEYKLRLLYVVNTVEVNVYLDDYLGYLLISTVISIILCFHRSRVFWKGFFFSKMSCNSHLSRSTFCYFESSCFIFSDSNFRCCVLMLSSQGLNVFQMIFWRALLRLCDAIFTWMWYLLGIVLDALNPWISCSFSYPFFYDIFAWLTLYKASTRYGCSLYSTYDSLFCYIIPPENKPTSLLYGGTIQGYCSLAHEHLNLVSKFFLYVFTEKTQCSFYPSFSPESNEKTRL